MPLPTSSKLSTPRGSRRWAFMVILSGFLIYMIADGINYANGVFLDVHRTDFKVSPYMASMPASIARSCSHIAAIFIGPLTKGYSCATVCIGSFFLGAVFLLISSFANSIVFLCITFGLFVGTSMAGIMIPCLICATLFFRKHRGLAVGLISSGSGVGSFLLPPISLNLIATKGWRTVYRLFTLLLLVGIIPAIFVKPQSPMKTCLQLYEGISELIFRTWEEATHCFRDVEEETQSIESQEILESPGEEEEENDMVVHPISAPAPRRGKLKGAKSELKRMRTLYHDNCVVLSCLAGFVSTSSIYIPPVYLVSYAMECGIQDDKASLLLSFMGLSNMVSRIILGWFVDLKYLNAVIVYCMGTLVGGLSTLVVWKYNGFISLTIYSVVYGLSLGCNISMISVVLVQLMGLSSYQSIYGIVNFWCGLGALCGPPALGYLYETSKEYKTVFIVSGIVLSLGAFFWFMTPFLMTKDVTGPIKVHLSMSPLVTLLTQVEVVSPSTSLHSEQQA